MGKKRSGIIKQCKACNKDFYVPQYRLNTANFCSLICQNHKQYETYKFICEGCGKKCETSPSRKYHKKKFCSIECRSLKSKNDREIRKKQKIYQILKRGNNSSRKLRKYISEIKDMKCEYCGYHEYEFCLDMHHIDNNPNNNHYTNIAILCCICHRKLHKGIIRLGDQHATQGREITEDY